MAVLLEAEDLDKSYPTRRRHRRGAARLRLQPGGGRGGGRHRAPAAAGKSTLLNILGGLDAPTAGEVLRRRAAPGPRTTAPSHGGTGAPRGVGFVFQFHFLLPDFTALENLLLPVRSRGGGDRPTTGARAAVLLEPWG